MKITEILTEQGVAEASGLFGPFTVTINTGERPKSRTKTKKFRREDDAILWAEDWFEDFPQYVYATAEITDSEGNVVWYSDETMVSGQGVSEAHDTISELKIANDNYYQSMGEHENFLIYVTKKPFRDRYVALAVHPRTEDEIVKVPGATKEQAVANAKEKLDQLLSLRRRASGNAIIDFNVKFAQQLLVSPDSPFFAKITAGPQLVIAGTEMEQYPEIMSSEGFKRSGIRNVRSPEGTTRLPSIAMTGKEIAGTDLVANGRYIIGKESTDKDGNRVYDLIHDSTVRDKGEKVRINQPALTVGSERPD
jgi:hypothetical protein